jgi:hypothetical protein
MSELERLREIIETLPPQQVHALLTLLDSPLAMNDADFARLLANVPAEDVDQETAGRILAADAEAGATISHEELKRRLGLATKPGL